ncbi:MAG: glycosyltransferase [Desulfobacteraceae bacterium]|jgi:glycosyltransferase involved in cell wall biosynthesis|nr:MAG: glycosyltransferase [Desulfobacteraceae bacterium]
MRVLFNSYNTLGAGPAHVTRFMLTALSRKKAGTQSMVIVPGIDLFADCKSTVYLKILRLPVFAGGVRYLFRGVYDLFILPLLSLFFNASAVIVLANYAPMPVKGKKIVFMRHPFLIDDRHELQTGLRDRFMEKIRKIVFKMTLRSTHGVIVQSHYMKQMLLKHYGRIKTEIHVLPNPVSNLIDTGCGAAKVQNPFSHDRAVLYVSRYYPHKQHVFLVRLADQYRKELRRQNIRFFITIDPVVSGTGALRLLDAIREKGIDDIICNLGELPNADLAAYYRSARCLFFPSAAETFGNPLIEAMAFGLPIIVPDLPYARSVCGDAGMYFKNGDPGDAYDKLSALMADKSVYDAYSQKSGKRFSAFPTTDQWVDRLLEIAA